MRNLIVSSLLGISLCSFVETQAKEIGKYKSGGGIRKIIQLEAVCQDSCATANYDGKPNNAVWGGIRLISTDIKRTPNINQQEISLSPSDLTAIQNALKGKAPSLRYRYTSFWWGWICSNNTNNSYCINNRLPITAGNIMTDKNFANSLVSAINQIVPVVMKYAKSVEDKIVFKLRIVGIDSKPVVFTAYWEGDNSFRTGGWRGGSGGNIPLKSLGFQLENPSNQIGVLVKIEYFPIVRNVDLEVQDQPALIIGSLPQPPNGLMQDNYVSPDIQDAVYRYSGKYIVSVLDDKGTVIEKEEVPHDGTYDGDLQGFIENEVIGIISTYNNKYVDNNGVSGVLLTFIDKKRMYSPDLNGEDVADFSIRYPSRIGYYKQIDKVRYYTNCYTQIAEDGTKYQICDKYKCTTKGKPILYAYGSDIRYQYQIRQELMLVEVDKNGNWSIKQKNDILQPTTYDYTYNKITDACYLNDSVISNYLINFGDNKFCLVKPDYFVEDDGTSPIQQIASIQRVVEYAEAENPDDVNPCVNASPEKTSCLGENISAGSGSWSADGSETCSVIESSSSVIESNSGNSGDSGGIPLTQ